MPNFSIYKIYCNNNSITDTYIGITKNIYRREKQHKFTCNWSNNKLYTTINNNGGWNNWSMAEIINLNIDDEISKKQLERYFILNLKPTLNTQIPLRTKIDYYNDNKDRYSLLKKQWYLNNKVARLKYLKSKIICECGMITDRAHYARHRNSNRHFNNLDYLNNDLLNLNNLF